MNRNPRKYALIVSCIAAVVIAGCFPEDALEWSADGSIGVARMGDLMGVVDGKTGQFKAIVGADEQGEMPFGGISISADGKLVAYSIGVKYATLSDALKELPRHEVKLLDHYARQVRAEVMRRRAVGNTDFSEMDVGVFKPDLYQDWLKRYVCENADKELIEVLTPEAVKEGKSSEIVLYKLFVATPEQAAKGQGELITTSIFAICFPRISPDNKFVAYAFYNEAGKEMALRFDLYVARLGGDIKAMRLADYVAPGYSWLGDSKAIVFLENSIKEMSQEYSIGTLRTIDVADETGNLLAEPVSSESAPQGSMATHSCAGKASDLAGVVFHPFMKVQCASGRIFFSSHAVDLPMSTIGGELRWSLFCYDQVTRSVSEVLPPEVSKSLGSDNAMGYFAVSPDTRKVLLPIKKHRFMIYGLGESSAVSPIEESEGFGDSQGDNWRMMPAWKGSDEVSTLVSKNSHFLAEDGREMHDREEIVLLGADGSFRRVLSESWLDSRPQDANAPQPEGGDLLHTLTR